MTSVSQCTPSRTRVPAMTTAMAAADPARIVLVLRDRRLGRIGRVGQQSSQMRGVRRCALSGLVGLGAARWQVLVVRLVHSLANPVGHATGRDREPDIVEPLEQFGRDVVRAVLVANDRDDGHPVNGHHPAGGVDLAQERVETLKHALCVARWMTHPDRRPQHEDVGVEYPLAQRWPVVAVTLVRGHARKDSTIGDA